ncbi:MAG: NAD-dependent DNA ligase LigA [Ferruginibacter sp.]
MSNSRFDGYDNLLSATFRHLTKKQNNLSLSTFVNEIIIMYTTDAVKKWLQKSRALLKATVPDDAKTAEELRDVLRFHEYRYYIQNDPLLSDSEYDILFKMLEKFENTHPALITKNSPTQRVGKGLIKDFPKVQHLVPMLSLQNSYNSNDLLDWDRKARELSGLKQIEYCIEPKFDGASISLIYDNDHLERAATRGDGETGDDITTNIKQIRSLPLSAAFSKYGITQIELRGEVMMNKNTFIQYNEEQSRSGLSLLANARNAAAGSLRMKDPKEVGRRNLDAFLYHVSYVALDQSQHKEAQTHTSTLDMLWDLGFRSPKKEMQVIKGIEAVIDHINEYENLRDKLPYEIDGMVIKVNDLGLQDKLGMTSHHPRWAIAYKFKARQATSKLLSVSYQVGRTGAVTPVAKIYPVQVGGVTVSSISIHNEEYIKEKDLKIGDNILIERSGDVIPQIVKSLPELRTGSEKKINYPETCPVCNDELFKTPDEAVWRCININCKAQVVERIIHFVSKDAMDIRTLGEANVRKFYELGLLKDIPGIYSLDYNSISKLEGLGEKSVATLKQSIETSKGQPIHRFIYGLGIRFIGETTAKTLAQSISNVMDLTYLSEEELKKMEDVGVKVAKSIVEFLANKDNIEMIRKLEKAGVQLNNIKKEIREGNLVGQTFLFTGTLSKLKRSDAEERVEKSGGTIINGVSTKLNYLVVGEDAGSKLEKAKKIQGIKIITEEEFIKMLPV